MPAVQQRTPIVGAGALLFGLLAAMFLAAHAMGRSGEVLLLGWLALGGLLFFSWFAVRRDILSAVCIWFGTLIILHEEFWRSQMPGFFAITIPRVGIVVVGALFAVMVLLGRIRLRWPGAVGVWLATLVAYFTISAFMSGFETRSELTVHYRLIGGYLFPVATFAFMLHGFHRELDFKRIAIFFAGLSAYLVFTGWCEQFELKQFVWPAFIADPTVGIHYGRVRGPFVSSPQMGLALVYCFFSNLVLAKNSGRLRWPLLGTNALMLPVIFWTRTRSVWLSFVLCLVVWTWYSRRRMSRVVIVATLMAGALLVSVANMENFMGEDRAKGGLTDVGPIMLRIGLAQMSWELVKDHPIFGVGFGHFRDVAPSYARDPSSPYMAFGTSALEHNNLLSIVSETGFLGLVIYSGLIVTLFKVSLSVFRKLPARGSGFISRDQIVLYWILATAYFADGMFRETSDSPFANCLFYGLSAVPVALWLMLGDRPESVEPTKIVAGPSIQPGRSPHRPRSEGTHRSARYGFNRLPEFDGDSASGSGDG